MRSHIDWLTFTLPMTYGDASENAYADAIENAFKGTFSPETLASAFGGEWKTREKSRAPYTDAWGMHETEITLFSSPNLSHCCVEISGQGCERLIAEEILPSILADVCERVTRIDIACDIETSTSPKDFVAETSHERMQSSGYQISATGETCYVGSQKSDRYARVYRYFKPHPRYKLLRIEHVFRRDYAKTVSKRIVEGGIDTLAGACGIAFGWSHYDWQPETSEDCDISYVKAERKMGATVFWLIKSVAPAFKRLVNDGTIKNPEAFVREYFLP